MYLNRIYLTNHRVLETLATNHQLPIFRFPVEFSILLQISVGISNIPETGKLIYFMQTNRHKNHNSEARVMLRPFQAS